MVPSCRCWRCCGSSSSGSAITTRSGSPARKCGRAGFADRSRVRRRPAADLRLPRVPPRPAARRQMSPEARQRALGVVCRLINAPSRRHTVVLMIETCTGWTRAASRCCAEIEPGRGDQHFAVQQLPPSHTPARDASPLYRRISRWRSWRGRIPASCCATSPEKTSRSTGQEEPIHACTAGQPLLLSRVMRPRLAETGRLEGRPRRLPEAGRPVEVPASRSVRRTRRPDRPARPGREAALRVASVVGKESGPGTVTDRGLGPTGSTGALCALIEAGFSTRRRSTPERSRSRATADPRGRLRQSGLPSAGAVYLRRRCPSSDRAGA